MSEAAKRIKQCLDAQKCEKGKDRDEIDPLTGSLIEHRQHVRVMAGDVVEACDEVAEPTQIVKDLRKGSAAVSPKTVVMIQASCAFHLIEQPTK